MSGPFNYLANISNEYRKQINNYRRNKNAKTRRNVRIYRPVSKGVFTIKNEIIARSSNKNKTYSPAGLYSRKRRKNVALLASSNPNKVYIPSKPISNATINTNISEKKLFNNIENEAHALNW